MAILLALGNPFNGTAQIKEVAASPTFVIRYPEMAKIFNIENNRTLLLRLHYDDLVHVQVYDKDRHEILNKKTNFGIGRLAKLNVYGATDLKGDDVLVYFSYYAHKKLRYCQASISKTSGDIHDLKEILTIPKRDFKKRLLRIDRKFIYLDANVNFVQSNNGQYHALYIYDFNQEQQENKQRVLVFDNKGNKVNEVGIHNDPKEDFGYGATVIAMDLTDKGTVYAMSTYFNNEKSAKYLLKLPLGGKMESTRLKAALPKTLINGTLKYIPASDEVMLLSTKESMSGTNTVSKTIIDKDGNATSSQVNVAMLKEYADKYARKEKGPVASAPTDLRINPDGSYKILFNSVKTVTKYRSNVTYSGSRGFSHGGASVTEVPYTVGVAYINYSPDGTPLQTAYVPRFVSGTGGGAFISSGYFSTMTDETARSFAFVQTEGKEYFLLNDQTNNIEHIEDQKKVKKVNLKGASFNGFSAELNKESLIPKVAAIDPNDKHKNYFFFNISSYNPDTKEIATIKYIDGDKMQLVWLKAVE